MSVLVVGISHRSAPVSVLERVALDTDGIDKLVAEVGESEHVREVAVVSTCNRVEIYADVERFHGSVEVLSAALTDRAGESRNDVTPHLYVHYDEGAVAHLFSVAAGLDSMVVGETQILGQVREALRRGQDQASVSTALNAVFQQALRVGKRAHAETDIDRAGQSLVTVALDQVDGDVTGRRVLVVGAGSMAALAVATAVRRGAGSVVVASRSRDRARRLAAAAGGTTVPLARLTDAIAESQVVISCTGATGLVVSRGHLARRVLGRRLTIVDLALPHDVDPSLGELPDVTVIGLTDLAEHFHGVSGVDVAAVRRIIAAEVIAFASTRRAAEVAPTVVALRGLASDVVETELRRLGGRLPDLDPLVRAEVELTVRRVADKLLHAPTVRVKELAGHDPDGISYTEALATLFSLDPEAVNAVTRPDPKER